VTRLLLLVSVFAAFALPAFADNWPQWRGLKNDGHSGEKGLPTEWGPNKNIVWKLHLAGRGASTPCIWEDKIFITTVEESGVVLLCIGTDGKEKWRQAFAPTASGKVGRGDEGNEASASCSTDGKHVWTFAGSGKLVCYTIDGKLVWDRDLQKYGKFGIQFGCHWTPVLYKDKLYLQVMHRNAQVLLALNAATGDEVWKVNRKGYGMGESPDVYASAFIWEGEGGPLLISHGNDYCTAHKLDNGAEVWRVDGLNPTTRRDWRFVSSPLVTPNLIVVPSCKNGPTVALNPVGAMGSIDPDNKAELWRINYTPDVVSPLLVDNIVYLMADGPLTALDAKTGTQIYREQVAKEIHRAHMVAADGKIYIAGRDGTIDVVQAGKTFKLLASNTLLDKEDKLYSSPAIANGRIYLRSWNYLWAIGTK
jgi:outer membrane protein assembly factor BamB